jgi:N-acetyl-anhydromuramyl-L-alanine amidase AmpD
MVNINTSKRLRSGQYYPQTNTKTSIFLHHTAGSTAESTLEWWDHTPDIIGTAYVIDRNGQIYEAFDPSRWAYHLGIPNLKTNIQRTSIGIELVSLGGLKPGVNNRAMFYPLWPNTDKGKAIEPSEVYSMPNKVEWRGYTMFHKYTLEQIENCIGLMAYLIEKFKITVQKDLTRFYEYNPEVFRLNLPGIWSHTTVRSDKSDIYPDPFLLDAIHRAFGTSK